MIDEEETAPELRGSRVWLRTWREADLESFAALNADPEVMHYFPSTRTREQSAHFMADNAAHFRAYGFGLWALEVPGVTEFAGFVGLLRVSFEAPFTPAVEVGWRLAKPFWGRGYATEAARLALDFAFHDLGLDEVVSFTVAANLRSRAVMERLGMQHEAADDFEHPRLPDGHMLRHHVLYRLSRERWRRQG